MLLVFPYCAIFTRPVYYLLSDFPDGESNTQKAVHISGRPHALNILHPKWNSKERIASYDLLDALTLGRTRKIDKDISLVAALSVCLGDLDRYTVGVNSFDALNNVRVFSNSATNRFCIWQLLAGQKMLPVIKHPLGIEAVDNVRLFVDDEHRQAGYYYDRKRDQYGCAGPGHIALP
jgi:hypothetical protein